MYIYANSYIKKYSFATKLSLTMAVLDQDMYQKYYEISNPYS
jgi:hypothetical protein